jgi:hypothetical protein
VVKADDKPIARLSVIQDFLMRQEYAGKQRDLLFADPDVVARFDADLMGAWLGR